MSDDRGTLREVIWQDICPWLILRRAVRLAISFRVLVLCAVALVGVTAGWKVIGALFDGTDDRVVGMCIDDYGDWPWTNLETPDRIEPNVSNLARSTVAAGSLRRVASHIPYVGQWITSGPVPGAWAYLADPFVRLFGSDVSVVGLAYLSLCCLWETLVWALFGGAVTRIAALDLAREERLGLFQAVKEQMQKWPAFFLAPVLPMVLVLVTVLALSVIGLLMRVGWLVWLTGLLWFLVNLGGLVLAILLLGLAAGWPLMWPTISTERTDAFDALSRSFAYVGQRPLYYVFLVTLASLLGILGYLVVDVFVDSTILFGNWAVSWGAGGKRFNEIGNSAGASLIGFWQGCVLIVKPAFQIGFFWSAATAIYLLMRRAVDATEMDEILIDEEEDIHSLPPMTTDEKGVLGIDEEENGEEENSGEENRE